MWPNRKPRSRVMRIVRIVYLVVCSAGMIFVLRFLLHYRQMLEDAMKQK